MATDPAKPFSAPAPPPLPSGWNPEPQAEPLPSLAGGGNSLAQAARLKKIKVARNILIALGVLLVLISIPVLIGAAHLAKSIVDSEIKKAGVVEPDPISVAEVTGSVERAIRVSGFLMLGVGILYFVLAAVVTRFPVPATITALVVYVGMQIIGAINADDPKEIMSFWLIKLLIIIALAKAVQAAIAYQNAENESQFSNTEYAG
jgi:hypothetical protein